MGVAVAFALSLTYSNALWDFVCQPAVAALKTLGYKEQNLVQIEPMEAFNVIWFKLPVLCAIFLAAPWILYQVWAFISPGLYRRERKWAAPFVLGSGGPVHSRRNLRLLRGVPLRTYFPTKYRSG